MDVNYNSEPPEKRVLKREVEAGGAFHHRDENGKWICSMCSKKFPTLSKLKLHVATHTGEKNYTCDHCGKGFIQKGNLDAHAKTHYKEAGTRITNNGVARIEADIHESETITGDNDSDPFIKTEDPVDDVASNEAMQSDTETRETRDADYSDLSMTHEQSEEKSVADTDESLQPSENVEVVQDEDAENVSSLYLNDYQEEELPDKFMRTGDARGTHRDELGQSRCDDVLISVNRKTEKVFLKKSTEAGGLTHYRDDEGDFVCSICTKKFPTSTKLKRHVATHTGEWNYACEHCGKTFIQKGHFDIHLKMHYKEGLMPFGNNLQILSNCDADQSQKRILKKTTEAGGVTHYRDDEGQFVCSICTKKFASSSRLKCHVAIHTGERNYMCNHCGKTFIQKGHLDVHFNVHFRKGYQPVGNDAFQNAEGTEKRLFKKPVEAGGRLHHRDEYGQFICSICDRKFYVSSSLKRHVATHTGERNHTCVHCGKRFIQKGNLDVHLKVHMKEGESYHPNNDSTFQGDTEQSGKRLFKKNVEAGGMLHCRDAEGMFICSICSKKLATSTKLKRHVATHTGEKNYTCEVCGKSFIQKGTLDAHVKIHYKGRNMVAPFGFLLGSDNDESSNITTDEGLVEDQGDEHVLNVSTKVTDSEETKTEACDMDGSESPLPYEQLEYSCDQQSPSGCPDERIPLSEKHGIAQECCEEENGDSDISVPHNQSKDSFGEAADSGECLLDSSNENADIPIDQSEENCGEVADTDEHFAVREAIETVQQYCRDGGTRLQTALDVISSVLDSSR